jgi:hypothetical protein
MRDQLLMHALYVAMVARIELEDLGAILLGNSAPYYSRNFRGTATNDTAHSETRSLKEPRDEAKCMSLLVQFQNCGALVPTEH